MIKKQLLNPQSIRKTGGSFAFIEHCFLPQGFWKSLDHHELLLYLLLILVADCQRISFYTYDNICCWAGLILEEYILARNSLMSTELTAFDGYFFQEGSLSLQPVRQTQRPI